MAFGALAVAAALATVMFGIYASVAQRIRDEFRSYGANLVAVAVNGNSVPLEIVESARKLGATAAPLLITSGRIGDQIVPVAAVTKVYSYWHVEGSSELASGKCLAGETLASRLNLEVGAAVALANQPCTLSGIVSTGGAEDNEMIVAFSGDHASAIEIQAPGDRVESIRSALAAEFPAADLRTVRAVAGTESNVVVKMRAALLLLTLLVLTITALCVTSNFSEMVIDRAKEIGIMKALGGAEQRIAAFFISESAALAIVATAFGYLIGVIAAAGIGREIFGGVFHIQIDWRVFTGVGIVMVLVATLATAVATSRIWGIQAAVILRGE